jgi:hypothetical protein
VTDSVGRPEGYVYVCIFKQVCYLVYDRTMESEGDPIFPMLVGHGQMHIVFEVFYFACCIDV